MTRSEQHEGGEASGRDRLLDAAATLFAAKGYAATSVRDILRLAGVTAPVLYYHFGNKEGIWIALVRQATATFDAALETALAEAGSARERIRQYCRAAAGIRREFAGLDRVVREILSGPPEAAPGIDMRGEFAEFFERLAELVDDGVAAGELRACNAHHVALILAGCVDAVSGPRVYRTPGATPMEELEGMLDIVLAGISPTAR